MALYNKGIRWTYKLGHQYDSVSKKIYQADCTDKLIGWDHERERNPIGYQLDHIQISGMVKKYTEVSKVEFSGNHILWQAVHKYANLLPESLAFPLCFPNVFLKRKYYITLFSLT